MSLNDWLTGFAGASPIEWLATVAGFLCVFLLIKRSIWNFAFGLVQVSLYVWIFWQAKLFSEAALHVFYMFFQFYGFMIWWQSGQDDRGHVKVVRGGSWEWIAAPLLVVVSTAILGSVMANFTPADFPYMDAFITCASLMAQYLLSHKRLLNWWLWIVVDIVAIGIYVQKGLYPTTLLYVCFLVMSVLGLRQWQQAAVQGSHYRV